VLRHLNGCRPANPGSKSGQQTSECRQQIRAANQASKPVNAGQQIRAANQGISECRPANQGTCKRCASTTSALPPFEP